MLTTKRTSKGIVSLGALIVGLTAGCQAGSRLDSTEKSPVELALISGAVPMPSTLGETKIFRDNDPSKPDRSLVPYDVRVALWSDGAFKSRYIYLPPGSALKLDSAKNPRYQSFNFPVGTTLVKHFSSAEQGGIPVETRVMTLKENNKWSFATYVWADDGTMTLNKRPRKVTRAGAEYRIPSEDECKMCHTAERPVLGFQAPQLDRENKSGTSQLEQLVRARVIDKESVEGIAALRLDDPSNNSLSIDKRTRAYMDVNCGTCHNPSGEVKAKKFDFRLETQDTRLLAEKKVVPGKPDESVLWQIVTRDQNRMPYLSLRTDPLGAELIRSYILQMPQ